MINCAEAINRLRIMRADAKRSYDYWKTSKKRIRPSERAMTLASYDREIEALEYAIQHLSDWLARQSVEPVER